MRRHIKNLISQSDSTSSDCPMRFVFRSNRHPIKKPVILFFYLRSSKLIPLAGRGAKKPETRSRGSGKLWAELKITDSFLMTVSLRIKFKKRLLILCIFVFDKFSKIYFLRTLKRSDFTCSFVKYVRIIIPWCPHSFLAVTPMRVTNHIVQTKSYQKKTFNHFSERNTLNCVQLVYR